MILKIQRIIAKERKVLQPKGCVLERKALQPKGCVLEVNLEYKKKLRELHMIFVYLQIKQKLKIIVV